MFALQKPSFVSVLAAVGLFAVTPVIFVLNQSGFTNVTKLLAISKGFYLFFKNRVLQLILSCRS
jgi:hypothetical protein